jgi:hypothetical protein
LKKCEKLKMFSGLLLMQYAKNTGTNSLQVYMYNIWSSVGISCGLSEMGYCIVWLCLFAKKMPADEARYPFPNLARHANLCYQLCFKCFRNVVDDLKSYTFHSTSPIQRQALVPPKPNELDNAIRLLPLPTTNSSHLFGT